LQARSWIGQPIEFQLQPPEQRPGGNAVKYAKSLIKGATCSALIKFNFIILQIKVGGSPAAQTGSAP
jgi:hypothetical protein